MFSPLEKKSYIVAVDMGYGHQRAVFPLLEMSSTPTAWNITKPFIISANDYPTIPRADKIKWLCTRKIYEEISRVQGFPIFGKRFFHLMSYLQKIEPFYPRRDLSKATFPVKLVHRLIKHGLGKHLINTLNENPLPLVCSFPIPALCAEEHGYKEKIYCLCTDTDIARSWAPLHPEKSRIIYLAPTPRTKERLKLYGVKNENIVVTGFPLPKSEEKREIDNRSRNEEYIKNQGETQDTSFGGLLGEPSGRVLGMGNQGIARRKNVSCVEPDSINKTLDSRFRGNDKNNRSSISSTSQSSSNKILLEKLKIRMSKLDPSGIYHKKFEKLLSLYLGADFAKIKNDKPLTITFAIGGAGAQSKIALQILASFAEKIRQGEVRLNLVAGTSISIFKKFDKAVRELNLESYSDDRINILYSPDKYEYFHQFNALLPETDILWTKPSELSFYVGLGLPIVMAPPLGAQEEFNLDWLHMTGAGFEQYDPRYADEWLFDWIRSGWLAEAAMNGFLNAGKRGADHIRDLVLYGKKTEIEDVHFV